MATDVPTDARCVVPGRLRPPEDLGRAGKGPGRAGFLFLLLSITLYFLVKGASRPLGPQGFLSLRARPHPM